MPLPRLFTALVGLTVLSTAASAAAPPLSEQVPADALVYLGWTGADNCPGYSGSHLKAVVDHSAMPDLFTTFVPQLIRRVGRMDEQSAEVMEQVVTVAGPMWHHPTAFYFAGVDYPAGNQPVGRRGRRGRGPVPRMGLMCDAGPDATALFQQIETLLGNLPPDADPKPTVTKTGSLVVLSFGTPATGGLATAANFTTALAQCKPDGATVVGYVDMQGVIAAIDDGVAHGGQPEASEMWPKARNGLGLSGLRRFAMTAGFDGKDWVEREFAGTDGSKAGILSLLDARPLDGDLLSVVPQTADRVSASRLDLAASFDAIRGAITQVNPDAAKQVDDGIEQVNQMAGLDVRRDLIGSLGDQWVTYADKTVGGTGVLGSVLVNRLRDPAKADEAMTAVSRRLNMIIAQQMHEPNVEIQFREQQAAGVTLHYLAVPLITPTWAVKGDMLYVGLYPQTVAAAVDEAAHHTAATHAGSILQRPEFIALQHRLGDHPAATISFVNLPGVAPDGYGDLLAGVAVVARAGRRRRGAPAGVGRAAVKGHDARAVPGRHRVVGRRGRLARDGRQPVPRRRGRRRRRWWRRVDVRASHDVRHARASHGRGAHAAVTQLQGPRCRSKPRVYTRGPLRGWHTIAHVEFVARLTDPARLRPPNNSVRRSTRCRLKPVTPPGRRPASMRRVWRPTRGRRSAWSGSRPSRPPCTARGRP